MWNRYRKWKPTAGSLLVIVALSLMTGDPSVSVRWTVGIGSAAVLIVAYLVEEAQSSGAKSALMPRSTVISR